MAVRKSAAKKKTVAKKKVVAKKKIVAGKKATKPKSRPKAKVSPKAKSAAKLVTRRPPIAKKAAKKAVSPRRPPVAPPVAATALDSRIALLRDNLRQLVEQGASSAGAASEELMAERITEHEEKLKLLLEERNQLAQ